MERLDFTGEWYGWRLRGRYLVSPDGERINSKRQLVKVLVVELSELRVEGRSAA